MDAKIYLNGSYEGSTGEGGQKKLKDLSSSTYEITAKKIGFIQEKKTIHLSPGEKDTITISLERSNKPPRANFTYSPKEPRVSEKIQFNNKTEDPDSGKIVRSKASSWTFGDDYDGDQQYMENPVHTYKAPGEYEVCLALEDPTGLTDKECKFLTVKEKPTSGITVEVEDSSGKPLDAKIYLNGTYRAKTQRDGKLQLKDLSPDQYSIDAQKEGYSSNSVAISLSPGEEEEITLTLKKQNKPPTVSFTYSPQNPNTDQEISFKSTSTDPDGQVAQQKWKFGDLNNSSEENPTHKYLRPGTYTIELTVEDEGGATATATKEITVRNRKPKVEFNFTPQEPKVGQKITLNASSSEDPDGTIEDYVWDLTGDGSVDKSDPEVTHTYNSPGTYRIELTVTDNHGESVSTTEEITVKEKPQEKVEIDEKYALVIGISKYKFPETFPNSGNLNYPAEDARTFQKLLLDETLGNFKKDKITLVVNDEATEQNIEEAFSKLITEADKDDLVVIYYSGHGTQGPDYNEDEPDGRDEYYVTYDTNLSSEDKLLSTSISDDRFGNWLKSISSEQIAVFLDSCYSGGATKSVKGATLPGQKAIKNNTVFNDFEFEEGVLLFSASQENQPSWESQEFGQGVFTHYLVKGLKGKADEDDDGTITGKELHNYLKPHVSEYVEENYPRKQVPLMKGGITIPLVQRKGKLTGEQRSGEKRGHKRGLRSDQSWCRGRSKGR